MFHSNSGLKHFSYIVFKNIPNIYSAGLELTEVYRLQEARAKVFWRALQTFWMKLYGSKKIFISAINVSISYQIV